MYESKKLRLIKEQEVYGLLHNLGLKTPLSKLPIFVFCFKGMK